jgi:orotidine-5'-phosphate decarboxylase
MQSFSERLGEAVRRVGSPLCVGIDPFPDRLPGSGPLAPRAADFGRAVVEACAGRVAAVKPQFAFFEAMGPDGMRALADTCVAAREAGLLVIGDAKRGDIGTTAAAYAAATLSPDAPFPCDALTVSPFLGPDTMEPFLAAADAHGRGIFVLLRTSNPQSAVFQAPVVEPLCRWLTDAGAARAGRDGLSGVGAVVGATHGDVLADMRARVPHAWLLVPGYGAQGATAADTRAAARADGTGALIVSARAATFPARGFGADPVADIRALVERARADLAAGWAAGG